MVLWGYERMKDEATAERDTRDNIRENLKFYIYIRMQKLSRAVKWKLRERGTENLSVRMLV